MDDPWLNDATAKDYPYQYNAKELESFGGYGWNDYGARWYDGSVGRFTSVDPLASSMPDWSPYSYGFNNPVRFTDQSDMSPMSPIYGTDGKFLGTDDQGLQGRGLIINASDFTQGMNHSDALAKDLGIKSLNSNALSSFINHKSSLGSRPDYDGFVAISEGVDWAKANSGALNNPTPANMLYIDASKLDFGNLSTRDFVNGVGKSSPVNLLNVGNLTSSIGNERLRATVYALGRVYIQLNNNAGNVSIINDFNMTSDRATDYDWNK